MELRRIMPAAFGHPELRSFGCTVCREAVTIEQPCIARAEQVSSVAQAAWPTAGRAS
jgi:hypothetical protein